MRHHESVARRGLHGLLVGVLLFAGCGDEPATTDVAVAVDAYGADGSETAPTPTIVESRDGVLVAFLDDDASPAEIGAVRERLEEHAGAGTASFMDHDAAQAEFVAMFKHRPDMVSAVTPRNLPRSLRVRPNDPTTESAIVEAVSGMAGVTEVLCSRRGRCGHDQDASRTNDRRPTPTAVPTRIGMLIVFLDDDASTEAVTAIRTRLEELAGPGNVTFFGRDAAYAEFTAMFKDEPDVVNRMSPTALPRSLRVPSKGVSSDRAVAEAVIDLPGVKDVICPERGRCL